MTRRALQLLLPTFTAAFASAQTIERVSVSTAGTPANADVVRVVRASADGRIVVFSTSASNLVAGDDPSSQDVFLRDRVLGTTTRLATIADVADVSADGSKVSYTRGTSGPGCCANPIGHVVDLGTGVDVALSTAPVTSTGGLFSDDGRFVAYQRVANPPSALPPQLVVRRELSSGVEDIVSQTFAGADNTLDASVRWISADGSIVTFDTAEPDIVPGDGNGQADAFYRDFSFGFSDRYSLTDVSSEVAGASAAGFLTPDTRFFLFSSAASGIVDADTNGVSDLFFYDRFFGAVGLLSASSAGVVGNGATSAAGAWMSPDGERVIFASAASNLVANDTNGAIDVFEFNTSTVQVRRLVLGIGGAQPNADVLLRGVSVDGRFLSITSAATNLVAGDTSVVDAYLVDLGPQCTVTSYCTSLPNSTGEPAEISSSGAPSFSLNNFVLFSLGLPRAASCVFFHGTTRVDPAVSFGDGLRCAGGTLVRLGSLQANGGGVIQFQDLGSSGYANVQPGSVRRFQLLYRDVASTGAGFNTTDALEVAFCP